MLATTRWCAKHHGQELLLKAILCIFLTTLSFAQTDDAFFNDLKAAYDDNKPIKAPFDKGMAGALVINKQLVEHLTKTHGKAVGYKAALTNPAAQKKFKVDTPIYGVLLEKMLHENGAELDAAFGVYPLIEGDLVVRVGDEAINKAISDEQFLASLDAVIPFIEMVDIMFAKRYTLDGAALVANNAGSRGGILGKPIALKADEETLKALGNIRIEIRNKEGKMVTFGYSHLLMEHPIKVVRWIRDQLATEDIKPKKGDLLSLGSMTKILHAVPGERFTATYYGMAGMETDPVVVSFK